MSTFAELSPGAAVHGRATREGRVVDATKLLKHQHDEVKKLFKRFDKAKDDAEKTGALRADRR